MMIDPADNWTIKTERLFIRPALPCESDVEFLFRLWTNGTVMKFVGFPSGFKTDREKISEQLHGYGPGEFNRVLLACLEDGTIIGECKLGSRDEDGTCSTDVKLSPEFWGKAYGREIKHALVDYLFANTDCIGVRAAPHRDNMASIKMQESVGARMIEEAVFRFPDHMRDYTCDVPHFIYVVNRETWERSRGN